MQFSIYSQINLRYKLYHQAYSGYTAPLEKTLHQRTGVATGNWGCGAFRGDVVLKFLIQLLAASATNRGGLLYHTYFNHALTTDLFNIHSSLVQHNQTIGDVYAMMAQICTTFEKRQSVNVNSWIESITNKLNN